jgi:hypothetical protein
LLAAAILLSACGGGGASSGSSETPASLAGNWQFTMAPPADGSFLGGLQGGFLLQTNGSVTGNTAFAVSLPGLLIPCNVGSAPIIGMISGQTVNLTAVAGTQTFTLTGTLSLDGSTLAGTYTSTAGTSGDGAPCGTLQTVPMQWTAALVPPITGAVQGNFHSTGGAAGLSNQDFLVSGSLTQSANSGASTANVSGTLNFSNSDYPCFSSASNTANVSGQISGNFVTLQIVGSNQSVLGQIGEPADSNGASGLNPVNFDSVQGGYILHASGPAYMVASTDCPGSLANTSTAGDFGNLCLSVGSALGSANACQQPIALTPAALTFPQQSVGTTSTQTITLANVSSTALSGLVLTFANVPANLANFAATDACGPQGASSQGQPFSLASSQSCVITIAFAPQCVSGCASSLNAALTVTSPVSTDTDKIFSVPVTGTADSGNRTVQEVEHD